MGRDFRKAELRSIHSGRPTPPETPVGREMNQENGYIQCGGSTRTGVDPYVHMVAIVIKPKMPWKVMV